MKKKIIILGSTGSIGTTTIKIISRDKNSFEVLLLTGNKNYKTFIDNSEYFKKSEEQPIFWELIK